MDVFVDSRFYPLYQQHPLVLVDAGARGGLKKDWQPARRYLRSIGFEPDAREHQKLTAGQTDGAHGDRVFGVALHSGTGPVELKVTRDAGLSSVFEPNRAFVDRFPDAQRFDVVDRLEVQGQRLDDVLRDNAVDDVDFLKVDTQGSELLILQGAAGALDTSILGLEIEVEFSPIYKGQPLFADVDAFLRPFGFELFDLRPCYWKRSAGRDLGGPYGQLVWADALYLRTSDRVAALAASRTGTAASAKVLKAVTTALLFGYRDLALELLQVAGASLGPAHQEAAVAAIRGSREGKPPLPDFPGKSWLAALARRGVRLFADPRSGWSVGVGRIGNRR